MASTSACHVAFSPASFSTVATTCAPKLGGLGSCAHGGLQLPQHAARGFAVFTDHGQTADALPYSEKILENELLTSIGIPALAMARIA